MGNVRNRFCEDEEELVDILLCELLELLPILRAPPSRCCEEELLDTDWPELLDTDSLELLDTDSLELLDTDPLGLLSDEDSLSVALSTSSDELSCKEESLDKEELPESVSVTLSSSVDELSVELLS